MSSTVSITTLKEAVQIKEQIEKLESRLSQILGGTATTATKSAPGKKGRRKFSAATVAKMRAAQQARWAKIKGKAASPAKAAPAPRKRRKMSAEARAKLGAIMKARWAARKKSAAGK